MHNYLLVLAAYSDQTTTIMLTTTPAKRNLCKVPYHPIITLPSGKFTSSSDNLLNKTADLLVLQPFTFRLHQRGEALSMMLFPSTYFQSSYFVVCFTVESSSTRHLICIWNHALSREVNQAKL